MSDYKSLLHSVQRMPRLRLALRVVDVLAVAVTAAAYFALLLSAALSDVLLALKLLLVTGIPFVAVSILRRLINAPRPYELYDIFGTPPKKRSGASFPSRHAFSVFAIAAETAFLYPIAAAVLFALGLLLSVSRVLLGKHFPRDVIAGLLIGVITSVIGMLII